MSEKKSVKPNVVIRESNFRNEVTLTKQNVVVTVSTDENLDRAVEKLKEIMEKYGGEKAR